MTRTIGAPYICWLVESSCSQLEHRSDCTLWSQLLHHVHPACVFQSKFTAFSFQRRSTPDAYYYLLSPAAALCCCTCYNYSAVEPIRSAHCGAILFLHLIELATIRALKGWFSLLWCPERSRACRPCRYGAISRIVNGRHGGHCRVWKACRRGRGIDSKRRRTARLARRLSLQEKIYSANDLLPCQYSSCVIGFFLVQSSPLLGQKAVSNSDVQLEFQGLADYSSL